MLIHVPAVLPAESLAPIRQKLSAATWVDGNITSGHQSGLAKCNQQLREDSPEAREIGEWILAQLARSSLFFSAALPKTIFPPLFNRYGPGMGFGTHVDGAVRTHALTGLRIRTDCSCTLFLTPPEAYDGGELIVEDTYGSHAVKLPAGDLVLYPSSSLHRVTPVTRGTRVSSFFWLQSMVREDARRSLLFDMDVSIMKLSAAHPGHEALVALTGTYHNLLRMWSEP